MAIQNINASVAGLTLSSGLVSITNFTLTMLVQVRQAHVNGEQPIFHFGASGNNLELRSNSAPSNTELFVIGAPGWEQLSATQRPTNTWVALGTSCAGVGTNQWTIAYSPSAASIVTEILRTLGGSTWTPTILRLFHSGLTWGSYTDIQNVKYGAGVLTAAQMHDECWSSTVVHTSSWTPLSTPMITGDLATQDGTFTQVSGANLAVVSGYFTGTSGVQPTINVATATVSGDDLNLAGTFTTDIGGQSITVELLSGTPVFASATAEVSGTNWTAAFNNVAAGTYTVRARIADGNGSVTNTFGSSVVFVGLSGEDELPYSYGNTAIQAVPTSASIPAGSTATLKAVNQVQAVIAGALVAINNQSFATAPTLTDESGNVVVTGVAAGATSLVFSIVNQQGTTLTATVPLTITTVSVSTVTVTPDTAAMFVNQTQQFTSVISGGGTTTWTVQSGGGSINSSGLYTAPATATTAVIRGAKTGELTIFDESTITVSAATQSSIGSQFLGNANFSVAPGQSFSWRVKVEVDGIAAVGAIITPAAVPSGLLIITDPLLTAADGTTTITAQVVANIDTGLSVAVTFAISAAGLTTSLAGAVTITDAQFGYLELRGRRFPRPYKQN